jgi:hypothetical protein
MPYGIRRLPTGQYEVVNTATQFVHARHTTKEKAKAQVRLLQAIEHGFEPKKL